MYSLQWIFSEVGNGGFAQCFDNSTGYLLPEAIEGSILFEAPDWEDVLRQAAAIIGSPFPRDRAVRQEALDALNDQQASELTLLDERLYSLDADRATSFEAICRSYVDTHPNEFYLPNPTAETVVQALLDQARRKIDGPPFRWNLDIAEHRLNRAKEICLRETMPRFESQVDSLLAQLPKPRD